MRCIVCRCPFDFEASEPALILKHVAYSYDLVHSGACADIAYGWIFPEPGFDCTAFVRDPKRPRVLRITSADGWHVVLPGLDDRPVVLEPLRCWAIIEYADGSHHAEALVRDSAWLDEPGGAEFLSPLRCVFDATALANAA